MKVVAFCRSPSAVPDCLPSPSLGRLLSRRRRTPFPAGHICPSARLHVGEQETDAAMAEPKLYQFQRSDMWKPVYAWLETLNTTDIVKKSEIVRWLSENPAVKNALQSRNSRYNFMHYIQKLHKKLLRKRGRLKEGRRPRGRPPVCTPVKAVKSETPSYAVVVPGSLPTTEMREPSFGKEKAFLRYQLLSELQSRLISLLSKCNDGGEMNRDKPGDAPHSIDTGSLSCSGRPSPQTPLDSKTGRKRRSKDSAIVTPPTAWTYSEASVDTFSGFPSRSRCRRKIIDADSCSSSSFKSLSPSEGCQRNIVTCLHGRERGFSWPLTLSQRGYVGRQNENWTPYLKGWNSLGRQFAGPAVWLVQKSYYSWVPTWCAYTSSVAVAQPLGSVDQGVQKVLDVRFHPGGHPQIVCSSNEAPNELLLYDLLAGKATELSGHNCQVWDSTTGACIFTLRPSGNDRDAIGHIKKINAMAVNHWQSCLVVTSGSEGDGKLLLWNALTGELASDLNVGKRASDQTLPSIDAMEFCNQNLLVCGSDSAYGGPALVQLWDIETPQSCVSFPASNSYITSLRTNPRSSTIITGAGDGTLGLFDIRTCGGIARLSVGSNCEVTSVSFSSCGTYFHASSTANNTLVWDTRLIPMNHGPMPSERPLPVNGLSSMRPLHCLSHGKPMPTVEHAGQHPGFVDVGDQGVNDARWLNTESILVTASGNGRFYTRISRAMSEAVGD
ncbi:Dynein assembly factor with WDR repeat domains 1 [Nymphaea thermarum]|nr:Dynein assembly factor with WDR repeat domains 1 [Nymphaea thermarum]